MLGLVYLQNSNGRILTKFLKNKTKQKKGTEYVFDYDYFKLNQKRAVTTLLESEKERYFSP